MTLFTHHRFVILYRLGMREEPLHTHVTFDCGTLGVRCKPNNT